MEYFLPYTDSMGIIHSIDMAYCEYFSHISPEGLLERFRMFHEEHSTIEYEEFLERPFHSRYGYYRTAVRFGGVFVEFGRYQNYDKVSKSFDLLPMFQLRFNPNKFMCLGWFQDLLSLLLSAGSSGVLRKYDYALDIPVPLSSVHLFNCRKERGLYKGTRYYGQAGRHGYVKVYDKHKDLFRQGIQSDSPLTRVEFTFLSGQEANLDDVYVMDGKYLDNLNNLKDTERCIVEMYSMLVANGISYDLMLGRKMMCKLSPYLYGGYKLVEKSDILDMLLGNICRELRIERIVKDEKGFLFLEGNEDLPFE